MLVFFLRRLCRAEEIWWKGCGTRFPRELG